MVELAATAWPDGASLTERVTAALTQIAAVWSYQLTAIDGRSLTVGKVVIDV